MNQLKIEADIRISVGCLNKNNNKKGNYLGAPKVAPIMNDNKLFSKNVLFDND